MKPEVIRSSLNKLSLSAAEGAALCGISRVQMFRHMMPVDNPNYRKPAKATCMLLRAYLSGYRPKTGWPETARKAKNPIKEIEA
jgi:hypothetical protein